MTNLSEVATYVHSSLLTAKVQLGIIDVWFGDQDRIPRTPAVAVEPGETSRELNGAPRRVEEQHTVYLLIYHNKVQSGSQSRLEAQQFAEVVEDFLHNDPTLGGLVIHSFATANESGFSSRKGTTLVTNRVTFTATSQRQLPMGG